MKSFLHIAYSLMKKCIILQASICGFCRIVYLTIQALEPVNDLIEKTIKKLVEIFEIIASSFLFLVLFLKFVLSSVLSRR